MRIGVPQIQVRGGGVEYRVPVAAARGPDTLWFRLDARHADLLADTGDAALAGLLVPAMAEGVDLEIDAPVSERLLHQLRGPCQQLVRWMVPSLRPIAVRAPRTQADCGRAAGVAAGFSGGIDSFWTLAEHTGPQVPKELAIDRLVFSNVGSHGRGERSARLFEARYARTRTTAERLGLPLLRVDSNLDAHYAPPCGFQMTQSFRNAAVALLLQGGIGRYLHSAGTGYREVRAEPADSISFCDPILLPMLGTERLDLMPSGTESPRIEKTLRVAELPLSWEALDICVDLDRAGNCSACWKCLRTLLTLEIAGVVDRYAPAFDLASYRRRRKWFMFELLSSDDVFYRDIVEFARARGFVFPAAVRAEARFARLRRNLAGALGLVRAEGAH